jgi:hypothetical protein
MEDSESIGLYQQNTAFGSTTKNEKNKASGDQLTASQTKETNHWLLRSNLEAIMETPLTLIPSYLPTNERNSSLLDWLNSFPQELPNPTSSHSAQHLCSLLECHKLWQLPLSHQKVYWAELLDLEYPPEEVPRQTSLERLLAEEEALVEDLLAEDHQMYLPEEVTQHPLREDPQQDLLEEGEILEQLEEGEIPSNPPIS